MKNKYLKIGIMLYVLFTVTNDLCCSYLDGCCLIDLLTLPSTSTLELSGVCLLEVYLLVLFWGCFPRSATLGLTPPGEKKECFCVGPSGLNKS